MKTTTTKRYLSDNFTSFSIRSSNEISSCFSSFFLSFFNTKPGGRAWRYIQLSPPPGQTQNHPYLLFSIASRKYLQTCMKTMVVSTMSSFHPQRFTLHVRSSVSPSQLCSEQKEHVKCIATKNSGQSSATEYLKFM